MTNVFEFYEITKNINESFSKIKTEDIIDVIPGLLSIKHYKNGKIKVGKYNPKTSTDFINICINKPDNNSKTIYTLSYRNEKDCIYIAQSINFRILLISAYCLLVKTKIINNKFKIKDL